MSEDSSTQNLDQAGSAAETEPAEGSVAAGEAADPTNAGQSSDVAQTTGTAGGVVSPEAPAEG